jgi:arylsulfatase A-like enzyme
MRFYWFTTFAMLPGFLTTLAQAAPATTRPNILFILADDMGYGDPRCFNAESKIPTPHVDRLASQGMRFTDAHAPGSVCVPSRYGLLTGRYPFRNERNAGKEALIEAGRPTIATLLKQAGYDTAMFGKWHLSFDGGGNFPRDFDYSKPLRGGPADHGFDVFYGMHASLDIPPYFFIDQDRPAPPPTDQIAEHHSEGVTPIQGAFWRGGPIAPGFRHEDVLPLLTRKSVEYLRARKGKPEPFFLYVAFIAPHTPWVPRADFRGKSGAGPYGDYAMEVDDAVGQVLAALGESGAAENTLVCFTSDNGPVWYDADVQRYGHRSAGPWRGMKGDAWEAGHHMPFIAAWPGHVPANTTCPQTICFTDMFATFASVAGQKMPEAGAEDSFDLTPLLRSPSAPPVREFTIHTSSRGVTAIRAGDWKLIPSLGSGGFTVPAKVQPKKGEPAGQLYDFAQDPGEQRNVYADHPDVVQRLTAMLEKARADGRTR